MPSCNPDDLMAAANEIYSKIPAGRQLAVQTYLMAVRAGVTTNPDELAELAKHFNFGDQQSLQVQAYTLCQIANGSGSTCANLEGPQDDPTGIYTPTFIGQVYVTSGHVWQATGLTSADWTEICTDCVAGVMTFETATLDGIFINEDLTSTEYHFPNLTAVNGVLGDGNFSFAVCSLLTSVDAPLLASVDFGVSFNGSTMLTTINLPSLQTITVGALQFVGCTSLVSLSLPSLVTVGTDVDGNGSTSLTTFSAPNWLPTDGTTVNFLNCALNQASVDLVLRRCVVAGVTTCTIDLSGGTNSAPSVAGQADKAALILAGNTVTTN